MNRLSREKAAYLRHAADQQVDWYPWCEEAFLRAEQEDKPVFLSTGAIWCHWCHVMAKECFENEEIIKTLNEGFINIKLDRDERPDIDRRYQQAVAAMGQGGGWPLSVFLTSDKKPFFGGTYFPPEDRFGKPGFKKILAAVSQLYRRKRKEVSDYSDSLLDFMKHQSTVSADISQFMIDEAGKEVLSYFDAEHGGFGKLPKFPMPGATEMLMCRSFFQQDEHAAYAVKKTLEAMAKGGFHDQIGGGFHRYSTDEAWIIPHFEKMADDNAWLLRNYADAYAIFGDILFREVAEGIVRFVREVLTDPEGGFYASQDADVTPDDEGGYFTWTAGDFRKVLDDEEREVLTLHLLHDRGSMHHDSAKKVLFVSMEPDQIAQMTGREGRVIRGMIDRGKRKLLAARGKREEPFIDRTIYTSLNGLLINAYLKGSRILGEGSLKDFALTSLDRLTGRRVIKNEVYHSDGVKGFLNDYIDLIEAQVGAYEITGDARYLEAADNLMETCMRKFWSENDGGFFDSEDAVLGLRLRSVEDIPHPSANSVAIIVMDKLAALTQKESYHEYALRALRAFSLKAKELGIHAGYYYCAADAYFRSVVLSVEASPDSALADTARSCFRPHAYIRYGEDKGYVLPCGKGRCYDPIDDPRRLKDFLKSPDWK
ncbi:MAG TPA: thioredoxin domain-containing protein [Thermodesulfovibrionales bacterium]|jgi:uncharacterized protein YyaL (SSP411 family)|nr:thioredoxin domain-containing protein [Thermodesulfovibrionales bacterium]